MTVAGGDDTLGEVTASPKRTVAITAAAAVILGGVIAGCGAQSKRTTSATSSSTATTAPPTATSPPQTTTTTTTNAAPHPTVINSSCKPPPQHPDPIVLVPGTYGDTSWGLIGPQLAELGYCVYTFSYGNNETGDIAASAEQLATFVNRLLARSGARRASIVGHSEGGMMSRYYVKFLGGAAKVDKLVALAPSNHGTLNPATFGGGLTGCVACTQQQSGSPLLSKLNDGNETPRPVDYTVIESIYDEVVIPYTSAFLSGPAGRVTNVTLQQSCPTDPAGHLAITTDPVALQWVENALASDSPADPSFAPTC
jgi:pimeloyl-ACP methyl ester carboxylesterase